MTFFHMGAMILFAGLQPGRQLPEEFDSAMTAALDSLDISRSQLDFDRHWVTGVTMADSTVIRAIQHVEDLPLILEREILQLEDYASLSGGDTGLHALEELVVLLQTVQEEEERRVLHMGRGKTDSLAALVPRIWLHEDDPLDWDSLLSHWGVPKPEEEMEMDSLADLMESAGFSANVPVSDLVRLALTLKDAHWPDELSVTLPGVQGTTASFCFEEPLRWVVGGTGPNRYTAECPFELIIDLGGDDFYGEGVGGSVGPAGKYVSVVIDMEGRDSYSSAGPFSQGCGFMGFGGVIDLKGDDTYTAGDFSQGAGIMGTGFLIDLEGDDTCRGGTFSQGAGCLGRGIFYDGGGDDLRQVDLFGQGFGGPGGRGTLADMEGSDCNLAGFRYSHEPLLPEDNQAMSQGFGMGLRPLVAGGIGLMADFGSGNDTYRAEVFGQGCAYFYSLGMLYDENGQDSYQAAQYSQGTGIHLAAGILWDGDGDDSYFSRNGPAQGSAHDLSTGYLMDGGGSDWYCSDGGQAFSLTNSACVFADLEGADTYCARGGGQGEARWARGSSGASVFLDLADSDFYSGSGADSSLWKGREYGIGIDMPGVTPGGLNPQDPVGEPESLSLDSLFSVASEWGVGPNRERVAAHREELAARGAEAVDYLVENHMGTLSGLESRAMEKVFKENMEVALEVLLLELDRADSLPGRDLGNTIYFLGKMGDEEARLPLEEILLTSEDTLSTGLAVTIIKALGHIGCPESVPAVSSLSGHRRSRVRRECAAALGKICHGSALETLEILSLDVSLDVRSAAERALELLREETEEDQDGTQ